MIQEINIKDSVSKRPNGKRTSQKMNVVYANGIKKRITVYVKPKKEGIGKMQENKNNGLAISTVTLCELMHKLVESDLELNIISGNSYVRKKATYKKISKSKIADIPIQQLTEDDLNCFMKTETRNTNSVIDKDYSLIRRTLNEAVKHGIIAISPLTNVRKPKSKRQNKKIRSLSVEEEKKLINILNNQAKKYKYRTQLLLMLYTGMRMGEINALTIDDINFNFNTIQVNRTVTRDSECKSILGQVTKTKAGMRIFKMNDQACQLLKDYLKTANISNPDKLIFYNYEKDRVISTENVYNCFVKLRNKYQFIDPSIKGDVTLHSFRHTFATRCIESGMPPKVLQQVLGHSDISITMNTYCDVFNNFSDEHIDKAGEYMKEIFS